MRRKGNGTVDQFTERNCACAVSETRRERRSLEQFLSPTGVQPVRRVARTSLRTRALASNQAAASCSLASPPPKWDERGASLSPESDDGNQVATPSLSVSRLFPLCCLRTAFVPSTAQRALSSRCECWSSVVSSATFTSKLVLFCAGDADLGAVIARPASARF